MYVQFNTADVICRLVSLYIEAYGNLMTVPVLFYRIAFKASAHNLRMCNKIKWRGLATFKFEVIDVKGQLTIVGILGELIGTNQN